MIGRYNIDRLDTMGMWLEIIMVKTRQVEHKTNETVLAVINERRIIMKVIIKIVGHKAQVHHRRQERENKR